MICSLARLSLPATFLLPETKWEKGGEEGGSDEQGSKDQRASLVIRAVMVMMARGDRYGNVSENLGCNDVDDADEYCDDNDAEGDIGIGITSRVYHISIVGTALQCFLSTRVSLCC